MHRLYWLRKVYKLINRIPGKNIFKFGYKYYRVNNPKFPNYNT